MKWKEFLVATLGLFGICLSIIAIFAIVQNFKVAIGLLSISLGILAIIWISIARKSLSPGSTLRSYTTYFLVSLVFVMLFSVWNVTDELFHLQGFWSYTGYIAIGIAYILFLRSAYQILTIGKEFGFQPEAMRIKTVMAQKSEPEKALQLPQAPATETPRTALETINKKLAAFPRRPQPKKRSRR